MYFCKGELKHDKREVLLRKEEKNMSGVEILSSKEIAIDFNFNWNSFWITFGVILIIAMVIGIFLSLITCNYTDILIGTIMGIIFGVLFGILLGYDDGIPTKYVTEYKVIISNNVQLNEFVEKYEIRSQEGKIYTVREKE